MTDVASPGAALGEVQAVLETLTESVRKARSMPMSASCLVNRADLLELLAELRARLPEAFGQAEAVLDDRAAVVQEGEREAERVVAAAQVEREQLVAGTDLVAAAQAAAARVIDAATEHAQALRAEAEDYVDAKLATFEVVLGKTLEAVERGRRTLAGQHELDALRLDDPPLPG